MATGQQQIQPAQEKHPFYKQAWFVESTWISNGTKWFLTFGGQAARMTLILCTLYMSAELYPGLVLPSWLNVAVFIVLNFALDMGGLGLAQIAKNARQLGKVLEAEAGENLSQWLIGVMIAGLVSVSLQNACNMVKWSPDWKTYLAIGWAVVEISLSIARVVLAVRYGHVLHSIEHALEQKQEQDKAELESAQEENARLEQALSDEKRIASETQANLQNELATARTTNKNLQSELSRVQSDLQNALQNGSSLQGKMSDLELAGRAKLQAAVQVAKSEVQAEMQARECRLQDEIAALKRTNASLKAQLKERGEAHEKPVNTKFDARDFVYGCLRNNPGLKLAEIVQLAKSRGQELSETTISRYRKDFRESFPARQNESSAM